jgi:hypothetical protein
LFVVPLFGSDLTTRLLVGVVFVRISVRVVFGSVFSVSFRLFSTITGNFGQHLEMMDEPLPEIVMTSRSGISGIRIMQKKKVKIGHKWTSNVSNCKMLPNGRLI